MLTLLKGKLTYILAAFAVLGGAAGYLLGIISTEQALTMIWGGLSLFGIRRALPQG